MCCPELETLHNAVMKTICSDVKRQEKRIWMEMKEEKKQVLRALRAFRWTGSSI